MGRGPGGVVEKPLVEVKPGDVAPAHELPLALQTEPESLVLDPCQPLHEEPLVEEGGADIEPLVGAARDFDEVVAPLVRATLLTLCPVRRQLRLSLLPFLSRSRFIAPIFHPVSYSIVAALE